MCNLFKFGVDIRCDVQCDSAFRGPSRGDWLSLRDQLNVSAVVRGGDAELDWCYGRHSPGFMYLGAAIRKKKEIE